MSISLATKGIIRDQGLAGDTVFTGELEITADQLTNVEFTVESMPEIVISISDLEGNPVAGPNLYAAYGAAEAWLIHFKNSDGTDRDLSDASAILFSVKKFVEEGDAELLFSNTVNLSHPSGDLSQGKFVAESSESDNAADMADYRYDFKITFNSETPSPIKRPKPAGFYTIGETALRG